MKQITEEVKKRLRAWADMKLLTLKLKRVTFRGKYTILNDRVQSLLGSIHRYIREIAKKEGASINQFILSAVSEKFAAVFHLSLSIAWNIETRA
jgi:hypothetical protein